MGNPLMQTNKLTLNISGRVELQLNFLGLGQNATIEIALDSLEGRKMVEVKTDENNRTLLPVFYNGESLSGKVTISVKRNGKLEYQGIKIELIGQIDFFADRGSRDEFLNRTQELARPGILSQSATYPFHFADVEKPYESYVGSNVQLRWAKDFGRAFLSTFTPSVPFIFYPSTSIYTF
ncbi:unnamed protein product [Dibothriocephalus latus]|uniref:Uncharacterized protein n=1 Tax=Dibothriocephalus latus TaxID=60516 RepID=A0A3P7LCX7_DIBLA|nr:unnamed protein product [Dibothriocephalus latus]